MTGTNALKGAGLHDALQPSDKGLPRRQTRVLPDVTAAPSTRAVLARREGGGPYDKGFPIPLKALRYG